MDRALSMRGTSVERLVSAGVGSDDSRVSVYINRCEALTSRELRQDFDCTIVSLGVSIATRCNEEFAETIGPQTRIISRDQYILDGLRGERVSVTQLETHDAALSRVKREEEEQVAADAERQKEVAIATAAAQKQAEDAKRKQEAADAALRQSLAQRDAAIQLSRRACSAHAQRAMPMLLAENRDHDVLSGLLNTSTPPLQAYQQLLDWLPNSKDRQSLLSAFNDRVDYDSKRWGASIARSGRGDYSWDTLKPALAAIASACLWQQYDLLGVGSASAISHFAIAIATGQKKPATDAERVSAVILSRIPSNNFFHP